MHNMAATCPKWPCVALLLLVGLTLLEGYSLGGSGVGYAKIVGQKLGTSGWGRLGVSRGCCGVRATTSVLSDRVRGDFPTLKLKVHGDKDLVYLDSAATSHKPEVVIEAMNNFYREANSNVHRGAHFLSVKATEMYEGARDKVPELTFSQTPPPFFLFQSIEAGSRILHLWIFFPRVWERRRVPAVSL